MQCLDRGLNILTFQYICIAVALCKSVSINRGNGELPKTAAHHKNKTKQKKKNNWY